MSNLTCRQAINQTAGGIIAVGVVLATATGGIADKKQAGDVVGYWKSSTGATYRFLYEAEYLIALYENPNDSQTAAGIKPGDLAYKGTIIGNMVNGKFYAYFPIDYKKICPGQWARPNILYLQVSDDFNNMEGDLLEEHFDDNTCKIDDRRITRFMLTRFDPKVIEEKKAALSKGIAKSSRVGFTSGH